METMNRIEKRKIEAEELIPVIKELEITMSIESISKLLMKFNEKEAYLRGKNMSVDNPADIISKLLEDIDTWGNGGDMEITFLEQTETTLFFDVKKCPYHELYVKLGIERYGVAFSCCRDEAFAKGFNAKLKLKRSKTLMEGGDCCDFRYFLENR